MMPTWTQIAFGAKEPGIDSLLQYYRGLKRPGLPKTIGNMFNPVVPSPPPSSCARTSPALMAVLNPNPRDPTSRSPDSGL